MRTKSAKEIREQGLRIMDCMAVASWNGKEYDNHANLVQRLEKVVNVCDRYVNHIYKYFGVDCLTCGAKVANEIYVKQMPAQVYTGKEATK